MCLNWSNLILASALSLLTSVSYAETATSLKAAQLIKIEKPYARAVPPGQPNSAIFMTLVNPSQQVLSLKSAFSPVAKATELHTTVNKEGVMEMRQVPKMDIPALGKTELKPGALHIMLIGLNEALPVAGKVAVTLTFSDDSKISLEAPVQEVMPAAGMSAGHHDHSMNHAHPMN